jgi:hypothetical protein
MFTSEYILAEYKTLRAEILQASSQLPFVTRHALSVIVALYVAPFAFKSVEAASKSSFEGHNPIGWILVIIGADLAILALAQRLLSATHGMRKLGAYIAVVLEPKTNSSMRYETAMWRIAENKPADAVWIIGIVGGMHVVAAAIVGAMVVKNAALTLAGIAMAPPLLLLCVPSARETMFFARRQRDRFANEFGPSATE